MGPTSIPSVNLNKKFLEDQGNFTLDISSPGVSALTTALHDGTGKIPPGEIILGNIKATAGGDGSIAFGGGLSKGTVKFEGHAEAAFGIGIYLDAADALKAVAPSTELSSGLVLTDPDKTRYLVIRAAYDLNASAKGSVALGTGASANFGVRGSSKGLFAVLHRFSDDDPAVQVFKDTFGSWALPGQVRAANDLSPGTWLIAEVDGSIALQLGVQAGYNFSWIREIPGGALKGDIGLRVQLGASAAFGFEASGKYAVIVAREAADQTVRLRLYKMAKKGWNFALDARVGIKAELPPFFNRPHKAEDLVAAIFGLNENQIIDVLRETRTFVNSNASLSDKLAGVLMDLGGKAIEQATGLSEEEIKAIYEKGRQRVIEFLGRFDRLLTNGSHDLTSMLLSLSGAEIGTLKEILEKVAGSDSETGVQGLVRSLLAKAGFERTPIGRFIEAGVGPALGVITNNELAQKLQSLADDALGLLNGDTLQKLLDYIRTKIHIDQVLQVANETDFKKLDNLLKSRLAAFLDKQTALLEDLENVQAAIRNILDNVDKFYSMALEAAKKEQQFSFTSRYSRSTTRTALLDVTFDLSQLGTAALFLKAVDGDFNDLLLKSVDGVTLNTAELTHNIKRNVSSELTMPFGMVSSSGATSSMAKLKITEDNGRVLIYTLDAIDIESQRKRLFGARTGRDSTLTIAASFPLGMGGTVKMWKDSSLNYSYQLERAAIRMRATQLLEEIGPLVHKYVPAPFEAPDARDFSEFVADLDKALDSRDPNSGTHDIGDTLITLSLTAPPAYLRAWTKAPADGKDVAYMNLSRALQAKLKELVTFYCFADPAAYRNLGAAAPPIIYSCLPPSTTIKLNSDDEVENFNTDKDLHWDQVDMKQVSAMAFASNTQSALVTRMKSITATLRGIPELASLANRYTPDRINIDNLMNAALKRNFSTSPTPELLGSLLFMEAHLVRNARDIGLEMARFRSAAAEKPAKALKHLADFGEDLAKTFNTALGSNPFLSGAARPFGTLLFMEAAASLDPTVSGTELAALLDITVIQSGKLKVDEMLDGKITTDLILHEQPFLQG